MTSQPRLTLTVCTAFCVALLSLAAGAGAQTAEWKSYPYPADGFQASFPISPELQKKDLPTEKGTVQLHSYIAQEASAAMFVGVCDYGDKAASMDAEKQLQGAKNAILQNPGSHLLSERKISLGASPGLEFEAQSDTSFFTARIYMVGSTLYQTLVITPLGKTYADTTRFLDSFQLIAKSEN